VDQLRPVNGRLRGNDILATTRDVSDATICRRWSGLYNRLALVADDYKSCFIQDSWCQWKYGVSEAIRENTDPKAPTLCQT